MLTVREKGILLYIIKHCYRIGNKIYGVSYESFLTNEEIKEIISFS